MSNAFSGNERIAIPVPVPNVGVIDYGRDKWNGRAVLACSGFNRTDRHLSDSPICWEVRNLEIASATAAVLAYAE